MGSNGVDHPLKHLEEEGGSSQGQSSFQQERNQKRNSSRPSSVLEIFQAKEFNVGSSPRRGLDHSITAPIGTPKGLLIEDHEIRFPRSRTERKGRHDLKLDRLSEREKRKLIVEMVKIQNDGTVEVDLEKSAPVASEFLELHTVEDVSINLDDMPSNTIKSIPRLKICILVVGTRGDVQAFLAMAKRFQEFGHHVRLATHANFSSFVKSAGVDFYPLGGDPRVLIGYMTKNKGLIPSGREEISIQRKQLKAIIESLLPACTEPDIETGVPFKAQAIIANPPAYGHAHVAEALGVPLHIFFTMPWTPTYKFPHPLARVPQSAGYWKLKLSPIAYFSTYHGSISHLPTGYLWSPHVVPKPSDWGSLVDVVGYCFLNLGSKYQPQDEFVEWIQKGPKPIYIGFGSMPLDDPKKTTNIILEALKDTGQRGIIDRGWGDLGNFTEASDNVFLLEDCPHDWLFPQCSAVVHHGGAGTTATGLRAGCPTTIVPFFGDQFFWGDRIHEKGLGPAPIPISQLTSQNVKSQVLEIAKLIENEDGVAAAVDAFHRHLPPELPLQPASSEEDELPSPMVWLFLQLRKWCCLPCGV
ncbi:sterol 3-beta-glucosyltransferase UGT80B1 [Pyrus ussuriensis x Pyrus communis]|uniref:Sterol 3-beta-glucosyltransferase UGT80B1 n=1 Tax=Pyrus ussuriensis x Pyrus communis TaxID=2448454 RepID=A0A5N5I535_9ROSA|nr:sterol 3-beta-glucosyltransferase UGT80B1 [Pyrus ussuriensis x Pyrus communis]